MLTLIKETGYKKYRSSSSKKMGLFRCDCGNEKEIVLYNVLSGKVISCGCANIKQITNLGNRSGKDKASYSHGMFGTRFYRIYHGMKSRCNNSNTGKSYKWYGGKGIKCRWNKFEDFRDDMYVSYLEHVKEYGEKQTTIDRMDSSKDYYKENCRWATYKEQAKEKIGMTSLLKNTKGHKRNHNKYNN